jgi:hypothetical protein
MDLYSNEIIAYKIGESFDKTSVLDTVKEAIKSGSALPLSYRIDGRAQK